MLSSILLDATTSTGPRVEPVAARNDILSSAGFTDLEGPGLTRIVVELDESTGAWAEAAPGLVEYLPLREVARACTGNGRLFSPIACAFLVSNRPRGEAVTTWRTRISCEDLHLLRGPVGSAPAPPPATAPTAAARLRDASGLDAGRLAGLFGVSRVSYQSWGAGSAPHGTRREHLLEVLSLVEEAAQRLGDPRAVGDWLLAPVSSAMSRPIDLLAARDYDSFRGCLLRVPSGRRLGQPLAPSDRVYRGRLSPGEYEDRLARLRPRAWSGDAELAAPADFGDADGERAR